MVSLGPVQEEMCFDAALPKDKATSVSVAEVAALVTILKDRDWTPAEALAGLLGKGWTDRKVRAVASACVPNVVSYPGSPGYKLWDACTIEEINHAIAAFESQARDMTQRAILYRNAYHRRFRG